MPIGQRTSFQKMLINIPVTHHLIFFNLQIYKCDDPAVRRPECYTSRGSAHADEFPCEYSSNKGKYKLIR